VHSSHFARPVVDLRRGLLTLALILLALPASLRAQGAQQAPVQLDFQDLDLAYVLSALAQAAGLNLVYMDLPAKPVTLRTATPVPRTQIPALLRSLAAANGVTVIDDGGFIRLQGGVGDPDPRQIFIYPLKNVRAATLAATLSSLFGGGSNNPNVARLGQTLSQQLSAIQNQGNGLNPGGGGAAAAAPTVIVPPIFQAGGAAGGVQGSVLIVPDEVSNSLLIRAAPTDYQVVQQAIRALDLRPLQVVIEVVIAEVRRTEELNLGLGFSASKETTGGTVAIENPLPTTTPTDALLAQIARVGNVNVTATLAALATTGDVRILSRPVVQAQNNQAALITVGSQRPFVQLTQVNQVDPNARSEVIQYRDVGTTLNILPTINEDGYVNLALTQTVSSATSETQFGAPIISNREAQTQLLARNGQTVVIGGLVDEQVDKVRSGVPFLKDIPFIGWLFGNTRDARGSSELFLFLTPYIVSTDEDADRFRERIEQDRELLAPYMPIEPLAPPVVPPANAQPAGTPPAGAPPASPAPGTPPAGTPPASPAPGTPPPAGGAQAPAAGAPAGGATPAPRPTPPPPGVEPA
jgi:type II secretory pathway component GspD/PulD (secretin)